jgi:hypothetical protein
MGLEKKEKCFRQAGLVSGDLSLLESLSFLDSSLSWDVEGKAGCPNGLYSLGHEGKKKHRERDWNKPN